jgi:hypothetical protein
MTFKRVGHRSFLAEAAKARNRPIAPKDGLENAPPSV